MADLNARAGLAKQRITILEQELDASEGTAKDLQAQLAQQKTTAAAQHAELQVRHLNTCSVQDLPPQCERRWKLIERLNRGLNDINFAGGMRYSIILLHSVTSSQTHTAPSHVANTQVVCRAKCSPGDSHSNTCQSASARSCPDFPEALRKGLIVHIK